MPGDERWRAGASRRRIGVIAWFGVILIASALSGGGCAGIIGHYLVEAPNKDKSRGLLDDPSAAELHVHGVHRQMRVECGPPAASLLVWIIDPMADADGVRPPPRGTVLVLHGYRNRMVWMVDKARALSRHGYRTVLVDLRGHGRSTGDYLTYGVQESKDLVQVIDALEKRGEIAGKLGVLGISYGGSTALMLAGRDARIASVVAIAPFASMREIVPHYVGVFMPLRGLFVSDEDFDRLVASRAADAGFDPNEADAAAAAGRTSAAILLFHGSADRLVPPAQSERIAEAVAAAGGTVRREEMPATGHISIYFDFSGRVLRGTLDWFERTLTDVEVR